MKKMIINISITLVLLFIVVIAIIITVKNDYGIIRRSYDQIKSDIDNKIGVENTTLIETDNPDYLGIDDPDDTIFIRYNQDLHSVANNSNDYENSTMMKRLLSNLNDLWTKNTAKKMNWVPYYYDSNSEPIEFVVTDYYLTDDLEELLSTSKWTSLKKDEYCHNQDGTLMNGYCYCVVDTELKNNHDTDIDLIITAPSTTLRFFDDYGELYWSDVSCDYISYQPGKSEKYAYYLYEFGAGESINNTFVFTVPTQAFDLYNCYFTINGLGASNCEPKTTAMILLDN